MSTPKFYSHTLNTVGCIETQYAAIQCVKLAGFKPCSVEFDRNNPCEAYVVALDERDVVYIRLIRLRVEIYVQAVITNKEVLREEKKL